MHVDFILIFLQFVFKSFPAQHSYDYCRLYEIHPFLHSCIAHLTTHVIHIQMKGEIKPIEIPIKKRK